MGKETVAKKLRRFNAAIEEGISEDINLLKKILLFIDFLNEYMFHGAYLLDYIQYGFYWKKNRERRKYIVHGKLIEMINICNNPDHRYIFDQKPEFNKVFREFLQREFLDTKDASLEDFKQFINGKPHFFIKQPDGMFGKGVDKVIVSDIEDIEKTFSEFKSKHMLCEETLTQCSEIAAFNDTSINTLRIVTIRKADGEVLVMGGLFRMGRKNRIADNFHHMGIAAYLDPSTGIVSTTGVDKNNDRHIIHPDSKNKIVGFQVPIWTKIVDTVKQAAQIVPDVRYIGWDVVITKDYKVALVEGNPGADPDAEQITTKEGRWPLYYHLLKDMK